MSDMTLMARELARLGTRDIFGIPGEGPSLELIDELVRLGGTFHSVGHEGAAALMAGGWGRTTGAPGVCLSIKGPGFSNLLAGIATNWLDRNPALSLAESYGPGSSPDRMHKRLAHAAMVRPVVKAYADNPGPDLLSRLWDLCMAEEPGPVHIDLSNTLTGRTYETFVTEPDLQPLPSTIGDAVTTCRRPVIIAGSLATRRRWGEQFAGLRVPVFTTVAAKGALDESLTWAAGVFTNAGGPLAPETTILPKADLIIGLGLRTTEMLDVRPLPGRVMLLDEIADRARGLKPAAEAVVKEESIREVLGLLSDKEWGAEDVQTARTRLAEGLQLESWLPAGALRLIQRLLPPPTRYVLDTGNFCTIAEHVLLGNAPGRVVGSACARSMGAALPTGVGTALAMRGTPTVIVIGDGGVRMYPEAIGIAVSQKLPVLVIIMNDGYYASVRQAAIKKGYSQAPLELQSRSWPQVFKGLGCQAERVESLSALANSVSQWLGNGGPLCLDVVFDATRYLSMTEGLR